MGRAPLRKVEDYSCGDCGISFHIIIDRDHSVRCPKCKATTWVMKTDTKEDNGGYEIGKRSGN